jgi:ribonuclease Y
MDASSVSLLVLGIAVGSALGVWVYRTLAARNISQAKSGASVILAEAEARGRLLIEQSEQKAKEEYQRQLAKANQDAERQAQKDERELARKRHELERRLRKLDSRKSGIDRQTEELGERETRIEQRESELESKRQRFEKEEREIESLRSELKRRCEEISGLTEAEAKQLLLENIESDVRQEASALVRRIETETKEQAEKKARQIITLAIQRCASDHVSETTVSVVQLPSDDMKGRIIGREGRNIRALEAATGCNIIVDDTPEAVVLSCFDPIRREIARQTLERLLQDGRIHPGRIEELVAKVERDLNDHIRQTGEQAVFELGLVDIHPELTKVIGRLKYRTSYGQNILDHSIEVGNLCSYMAAELGADAHAARRAGFLHDIGKALTHEMEGTHALLGAELCKKYNEPPGVVHAIASHHNEVEPRTIIAVLVQGADAISSARPGARRETLENYVKRLRHLEEIADSFRGVTKAYAIQAGREIRIMVEPTEINDNEACLLARDVAKRVEKDVEYPGQIKVTVCRELRAVDYAK